MRPLLLAVLLLAACRDLPPPELTRETAPGSDEWAAIDLLPEWTRAPQGLRDAGTLWFVGEGRSNVRNIVTRTGGPRPDREVEAFLAERLAGVLSEDELEGLAERATAALRLEARVCREELLTRRRVAGNTLATCWGRWRLALEDVVRFAPEPARDAVRDALSR